MGSPEKMEMRATSIVCMFLFAVSGLVSIAGLFRSCKASNKSFLRIFFIETLSISILEIGTGVLAYFNSDQQNVELDFVQRIINSFSVVFLFALILTIAYGWKVACWKIKESTYSNFNDVRSRRVTYIVVVITLFLMEMIANSCLLIYFLITGRTSQFVINIFDLVLELSILGGCLTQVVQGRRLSQLLTTYEVLFGVRMKRWRFNLVYIAAFVANITRCALQLSVLSYYFIEGKRSPLIIDHFLAYYSLYMGLELLSMILYLMAIKSSGSHASQPRSSTDSHNRSSIQTQMVDRSSTAI